MTVLPSSLALTSIADGSNIVAADHRNNYTAVQTALNALIALLAAGSTGQTLVSSGGTTIGWQTATATTYRKTTAKTVNTTTTATDLLNGEVTIGAGVMGTTGLLRLTAWGDWLQNSGGAVVAPRFQVLLGGTTLLDTGTGAGTASAASTRFGWRIGVEVFNLGSASVQSATIVAALAAGGISANGSAAFTTGEGSYALSVPAGGTSGAGSAIGYNAGAVDTSTSKALVLNVINGSANAAYETKLLGALVEII